MVRFFITGPKDPWPSGPDPEAQGGLLETPQRCQKQRWAISTPESESEPEPAPYYTKLEPESESESTFFTQKEVAAVLRRLLGVCATPTRLKRGHQCQPARS